MKIRELAFVVVLSMFFIPLQAQNKFNKLENQAEENEQLQLVRNLLESRKFILSADYVYEQYEPRKEAYSDINFIKIDSSMAVIQTGAAHKFESNRVGGFTKKGEITQWELNKNTKKNTVELTVHIVAKTGTYDVLFFIHSNGRATANVSGTNSVQLVFDGYLSPLEETAAYEGETF